MAKKKKAIKREPKQQTPYDITPPPVVELSMSDKFYIEANIKSQSPEVISKAVNKPIELVQQYISSLPTQKQMDRYMDIVSSGEKAKGYIRTEKGATIMTETAAEIADAHKSIGMGKRNMTDRIHKMK